MDGMVGTGSNDIAIDALVSEEPASPSGCGGPGAGLAAHAAALPRP
jgi:hypothetical protein